MAESFEDADRTLAVFQERQSEEGRFLRYCRGRSGAFSIRAVITVLCTLGLCVMGEWRWGLLLGSILAAADIAECAFLMRVARRGSFGHRFPLIYRVAAVMAGVQTVTAIAVIASLASLVQGQAGFFLAMAMFLSGILDGAQYSHLHRGAGFVRMAAYGLSLCGAVFLLLRDPSLSVAERDYWLMGTAMLVYINLSILAQSQWLLARRSAKQLDLLTSARDLAKLNATLAETQEITRRLGKVVESVSDAILVVDPDGTISWANDAFFDLTGYDRDGLIHTPIDGLNLQQEDDAFGENVLRAVREGKTLRVELSHLHPEGRTNWVDLGVTPVMNDDGQYECAVLVARDIGAAKERETALAAARRSAEDAMRAKEAFLATMSHEIRTPMNGILGTTDLLLESKLTSQQRSLVQTISNSGDGLLTIVNDILDVSALEAGHFRISQQTFDPNAFIHGALDTVRPLALAKDLALVVHLPDAPVPHLVGDPGRLRQILLNLLGNAIKFTDSGEVTLRVGAETMSEGMRFQVEIADTGIGIAPDKLAVIFDMFIQADDTIGGRFGGTGLGLAISKRLAEAMGGSLTARSEVGRGSVFVLTIELPFAQDLAPHPAERAHVGEAAVKGHKILIADDNKTNIFLLEKMLSGCDLDIVIAVNGMEAVELNAEHAPHLILMDVRMPLMNGLEATGAIRAAERSRGTGKVPIIALTANAFPEDREKCAQADMTDFLSKPYRKRDLFEMIARHLPPEAEATVHASQVG